MTSVETTNLHIARKVANIMNIDLYNVSKDNEQGLFQLNSAFPP